jgi:hypothetical protein
MRQRILIGAALFVTIGGVALAGRQYVYPVTVDPVRRRASGALGSAQKSSDTFQYIGCSVHYDAVNDKNNANCAASDAAGVVVTCATQKPELVELALAVKGDSFLEFRWDAARTCTFLFVGNYSLYESK